MSGYDLQNVKRIERENGHLREVISELRRDLERARGGGACSKCQARAEGQRLARNTKPPAPPTALPHNGPPEAEDLPALGPKERAMFVMLRFCYPNIARKERLIQKSGMAPSGFGAVMFTLRAKLLMIGWNIERVQNGQYRLRPYGEAQ